MVKIEQSFPRPTCDYLRIIQAGFNRYASQGALKAGQKIAVAVGSRGIASLPVVVETVVDELKEIGCIPYIVPAMGSHGGATAEGQAQVLDSYGISEESMGVPIVSNMEVDQIGEYRGQPIYFDRFALSCDGVVAINRVKPHTDFHGSIESGVCKLLSIGLGKHQGAISLHSLGSQNFPEVLPYVAALVVAKLPLVIGIPIVENAYHEIACLNVVSGPEIYKTEKRLLKTAYGLMAKLPFEEFDLLVIDEIGKDISGAGMDPNITGRNYFPWVKGGPKIDKIVILDISPHSDGNPSGMGVADVITRRILDKSTSEKMYTNSLACKSLNGCKIPFTAENDRDAISAAMFCKIGREPSAIRAVRIKNTLELMHFEASEFLARNIQCGRIQVIGEPFQWVFDPEGYLPKL